MLNLNLNLNLNESELLLPETDLSVSQESSGVAVIGIDIKAGAATSKDAVWQVFAQGLDMIGNFPENRVEDAQSFARCLYGRTVEHFSQRAYLPQIDQFEAEIFKLSQTEAELIDPIQRIYLESAFCAIEDAGYGGDRLWGSNTGVYVGFNQVGESYESLLADAPQEALGLTVSGNIGSFLASRISYFMNLTGPAMVIDTACSSSLVALHQACQALKRGEIENALVGSLRIFFCPEKTGADMGTSSSDERTRSFDASADGTGGGEGVINLFLKPLRSAIRDGDHIYGVIKGSSSNQDGSSMSITAPNAAAQEKVLLSAWEDAGVDPEQISYIEAHGTGTRLGDPVEYGALTAAFSRFTQKKQFCALGAAKSNFGHLDCASGLLGVVKVLLMMEHKMIPPSLHFKAPNSKIDYIHSPLYLNDSLRPWNVPDNSLIAGVSSFGLSGTNCHVVLQSYEHSPSMVSSTPKPCLLAVSARTRESCKNYLLSLQAYLAEHPEISLEELCYSLSIGRGQYGCRFAMVLENIEEFLSLQENALFSSKYYAELRIGNAASPVPGLLRPQDLIELKERWSREVAKGDLLSLSRLYLMGAEADFTPLYYGTKIQRVSLPSYPFQRRRCWYTSTAQKAVAPSKLHPLVDACIADSKNLRIYSSEISSESCMELREHRINGVCVLPGTVYLEILHVIGKDHFGDQPFTFENVTFLSLLSCKEGDSRTLHSVVHVNHDGLSVCISGKDEQGNWIDHVQAELVADKDRQHGGTIDLPKLLESYPQVLTAREQEEDSFVSLGEHWHTGQQIYVSQDSVVLYSQIPLEHKKEAASYSLYPPLLDGSMNSGILLLQGQYLPLNYKNLRFYAPIRGAVYSRISRMPQIEETDEIASFRVELYDQEGLLLGEVEQYSLKRVHQAQSFLRSSGETMPMYHLAWIKEEQNHSALDLLRSRTAVVLLPPEQLQSKIVEQLRLSYSRVILLQLDMYFMQRSSDHYCIRNSPEDMQQVLQNLGSFHTVDFISLVGLMEDPKELSLGIDLKIRASFHWLKALSSFAEKKRLLFFTLQANRVTGEEVFYAPLNQGLISFLSCIESEQSDMNLQIVDTDLATSAQSLVESIGKHGEHILTAYRNGISYVEKLLPIGDPAMPVSIGQEDVILISGGFGGIGLVLCKEIFRLAPHAKVVLLSRNPFITEERKAAFDAFRAQGFTIDSMQADVSDYEQVALALEQVRQRYGAIHGIIHAAGIAGDGMLAYKSWDTFLSVLQPKLHGAVNLDRATENDPIKYMILFSSLTAVVGAPGQTDYACANGFLDGFTHERNLRGRKTITIDWTGWKDSGMAKAHGVDWQSSFVDFVSDEEGSAYFTQALSLGHPRILAGSFHKDLPKELGRRFLLPEIVKNESSPKVIVSYSERPVIYGKSPDKITEVEENIALAWARTLQCKEVNLYDKFFEAGGNSLLASYLQKEINEIYPDAMAITDVFVYSTIADIAGYISAKLGIGSETTQTLSTESTDLETLVQQFMDGELSLEDIENLV